MDQYISKTKVEDEIKRHLNIANTGISYAQSGINYGLEEYKSDLTTWTQCQYTCRNILAFLDTLETKEVDLEKELKTLDNTLFDLDGVAVQGATHYITVEDVKYIAKHFFELGLKAQKGD